MDVQVSSRLVSIDSLLCQKVPPLMDLRQNSPGLRSDIEHVSSHSCNRISLQAVREKNYKRETKLIQMLIFIKGPIWKNLFGKEADKLEQANGDDKYVVGARKPRSSVRGISLAIHVGEWVRSKPSLGVCITSA